MTRLKVDNLRVKIGNRTAVDDLSFELPPARILGLTGVSGSGKSMTGYALLGLLPDGADYSGRITLDGKTINPSDDTGMQKIRGKDIGFVFQEPSSALNPLMTIGQQIAEVFKQHQKTASTIAAAEAAKMLSRVGLTPENDFARRYPHQLSGGQKQRVCIAIAAALKPKLLIADEATTALDSGTQKDILALLKNLVREDGLSMILITHDLAVVADMADDVLVLESGKKASFDPVEVMANPPQGVLRGLIQSSYYKPSSPPTSPPSSPLLFEAKNISQSYGHFGLFNRSPPKPILNNISFTIHEGQQVALVGKSGSGKSTLSRIMLGLEAPKSGSIAFHGGNISAVFQDPYHSFNPRMTIADSVAEPLYLRPDLSRQQRQSAMLNALDAAGLNASYASRFIQHCSGGERQRVGFARAIITDPDLIILDEAVSALDAPRRLAILDEIVRLAKSRNIATLFISHDLSIVQSFCSHVMVLDKGQIIERGTATDIFKNPKQSETKNLIAASLDLNQILKKIARP